MRTSYICADSSKAAKSGSNVERTLSSGAAYRSRPNERSASRAIWYLLWSTVGAGIPIQWCTRFRDAPARAQLPIPPQRGEQRLSPPQPVHPRGPAELGVRDHDRALLRQLRRGRRGQRLRTLARRVRESRESRLDFGSAKDGIRNLDGRGVDVVLDSLRPVAQDGVADDGDDRGEQPERRAVHRLRNAICEDAGLLRGVDALGADGTERLDEPDDRAEEPAEHGEVRV